MTRNPYRAWLLGIALTMVSLGSIVWLVGLSLHNGSRSFDELAGLVEMAWGGDIVRIGLVLLVVWLAVSAVLFGLQRPERAAENGEVESVPAGKRPIDLREDIDLR